MIGFQLSDFQLIAPIGAGAVGEVWRGLHRTGAAIAVKVLTSERARQRQALQTFRHEARALAGLDHPYVVRLLDFGEVPAEDAERSEGRLLPGSPYLVMEYARGGTLLPWCGAMRWTQLRLALLALLDALGHAHARGVIHRDLKPGNVLLSDLGDPSSSLRLADFGIAHHVEDGGVWEGTVAGTPLFIAPEQRANDLRAQGPWTDLYALGRVALALGGYTLAPGGYTGVAPRPLPNGFEAWVARLTQEEPCDRPRTAADAKEGLRQLVSPEEDVAEPEESQFDDADTFMITDMITELPGDVPAVQLAPQPTQARRLAPPPAALPTAQLPHSWRGPQGTTLRPRLRGIGLGLFPLRRHSMVGRVEARDRLWQSLRDVDETGRPRLILLRGAPGVGKRELARWLSLRAEELGGVGTLSVHIDASLDDAEALAAAFRRALRAEGLSPDAMTAQVRRALSGLLGDTPNAWRPLSQALRSGGSGGPEVPSAERRAILLRGLALLANQRPLIMLVDDVRSAPSVMEFVDALLTTKSAPPVLVLASDPSPDLPLPRSVASLVSHRRGESLNLPPLPIDEQASLLRDALGIEPRLAATLAERTEGNPLFAVEVVSGWVQRGLLTPSPQGHRLQPGVDLSFPSSPQNLWKARLEPLLGPHGPQAGQALELAAALGLGFDDGEWRRACAVVSLPPPDELVEELTSAGLLVSAETPNRRRFRHVLLRGALQERAQRAGRWQRWNRAIVNMLMPGFTDHNLSHHHAERVGRHLLAAGEPLAALPHLSRSLARRLKVGDHANAEVLLQELDLALESLADKPEDSRWGERAVLHAQLAKARGRRADARRGFEETLTNALERDWPRIQAKALQGLGDLDWLEGDAEQAMVRHKEAAALAEALFDPELAAASHLALGILARRVGRLDEALARFQDAVLEQRAAGDRVGEAYALRGIGECQRALGALTEARSYLERALAAFNEAGAQRGTADTLNSLGELAKREGLLEESARLYASARDRLRVIGSPMVIAPETNLALVLLEQGRAAEARQVLLDVLASLERGDGPRVFKGNIHAYLLPCAAAVGDWSGFDRHVMAARVLLDESGEIEEDVARLSELAGDAAAEAGKPYHAQDAWRIALAQRRAMGQSEAIDRIEARMASLRET